MVDGTIIKGEAKLDIFTRTAIITTAQSARDFFSYWDGSKLNGIYCLDLDNEVMKKVEVLQEALDFYDKDRHKCECGKNWNEDGVCTP